MDGPLCCFLFSSFHCGQFPLLCLPTRRERDTLWAWLSLGMKFLPLPVKTRQVASSGQIKEDRWGWCMPPQLIEWDLAPVLWLLAPIVVCATDTVQVDWNPTLEPQCYPREASGDREKPVLPLDGTFLGPSWHMPYKVRLHNDRRSSGVSHA